MTVQGGIVRLTTLALFALLTTALAICAQTPADAMLKHAERLSSKNRHEEAIAEFQRALAIDPQYYEAENNLALERFHAWQPELAVKALQHLVDTVSQHVFVFNNLAGMLCQLHQYPEAEKVER